MPYNHSRTWLRGSHWLPKEIQGNPGKLNIVFVNTELNLGVNDFSTLDPQVSMMNRSKLNRITIGIALTPPQFNGPDRRLGIFGFVIINLVNVIHQFCDVTI